MKRLVISYYLKDFLFQRNPFLDAEAEDEEGQDEEFVDSDEEDLQLKLDSVDYDDDGKLHLTVWGQFIDANYLFVGLVL